MASAAFEKARKSTDVFMAGGVALTFPAFDDLPEKKLWLGTKNFEGDDGENYKAALVEQPFHRSQKALGQDGVDFAINDPESKWYEILKPYEDVVVDTSCIVRDFLLTENDIYESEIVLPGYIEQMSLNEGSLTIPISVISDMSRTGFLVGGRILTQRYCAAKFNKNGVNNPLYHACGWTTAQGGNPLFCTHKRKGLDGCEDHMNDWRILAVEALSSAEITTTSGASGWGYGTCFPPKTLVWMADGSYKPIWQVKIGDFVMSFTVEGKLVKRKVLHTFADIYDSHLVFDFGNERELGISARHRINIAHDLFKEAAGFDAGDTVRCQNEKGWFDLALRNNWLKEQRSRLHNFEVWGTHTYFVVVGDTKIAVSNRKREDEILT